MKVETDIDIDLYNRDELLENLHHVAARQAKEDGEYTKHISGVYFQDIPYNPIDGIATVDYKEAEELGYTKIDFLNNSVYKGVKDEEHLMELISMEPMWDMLNDETIVEKLFHIGQHTELVKEMKPRGLEELAMLLAIIRPGKSHLRGKDWDTIREEVWEKPTDDSYYFKKSHSFGYAMAIIVQMNLMMQQAMRSI